jgi:hypothetical protein
VSEPIDPQDDPRPTIEEAPNPYRLEAGQAFMLGTLVGLLGQALEGGNLHVSPIADQHGNYLRLVRFTLDETETQQSFSWMLALVTE